MAPEHKLEWSNSESVTQPSRRDWSESKSTLLDQESDNDNQWMLNLKMCCHCAIYCWSENVCKIQNDRAQNRNFQIDMLERLPAFRSVLASMCKIDSSTYL